MPIGLAAEYLLRYLVLPLVEFVADLIVHNGPLVVLVLLVLAGLEYVGVPVVSEWLIGLLSYYVLDPLIAWITGTVDAIVSAAEDWFQSLVRDSI
jgi:hypothetical protein